MRAGRLGGSLFGRQQVIGGYIVDFYCHQSDLVVDVDGETHVKQGEYDREREEYLKSRGLRVIRLTNDVVRNRLEGVLEKILEK